MDASWLKLIYLEKNSDEYSVAVRSFGKEGGHPKRYVEMVGLCEFRGFVAIITRISNNTRLTYTRRMLPTQAAQTSYVSLNEYLNIYMDKLMR